MIYTNSEWLNGIAKSHTHTHSMLLSSTLTLYSWSSVFWQSSFQLPLYFIPIFFFLFRFSLDVTSYGSFNRLWPIACVDCPDGCRICNFMRMNEHTSWYILLTCRFANHPKHLGLPCLLPSSYSRNSNSSSISISIRKKYNVQHVGNILIEMTFQLSSTLILFIITLSIDGAYQLNKVSNFHFDQHIYTHKQVEFVGIADGNGMRL